MTSDGWRKEVVQASREIPKRLIPAAKMHDPITPPQSSPLTTPILVAMSLASPLRRHTLRAFEAWTCSTCSRTLSQLPRTRYPTFATARRNINTSNEIRQSHVPRMDQMHERYKQKNRTVMYGCKDSMQCPAY